MKVALLHYWLINLRGGEKVLAELASLYPEADIFTHACDPSKIAAAFEGHRIHETFIGKLPLAKKHCQKYLPLMPLALKQLNLEGYDLIISSESGPVKGIRKPRNAYHLCYCHTPMRYLWDMYREYWNCAGPADPSKGSASPPEPDMSVTATRRCATSGTCTMTIISRPA